MTAVQFPRDSVHVTASNQLPAEIEAHVRAFQIATSAITKYRPVSSELAEIVRHLARWSVIRCPPLRFEPKGEKDQATVSFVVSASSRVLWMAYPASKAGDPKIEFLVRASKYASPPLVSEFRQQLVSLGVRSLPGRPNEVLAVAVSRLRDAARLHATVEFLDWALSPPILQSLEA